MTRRKQDVYAYLSLGDCSDLTILNDKHFRSCHYVSHLHALFRMQMLLYIHFFVIGAFTNIIMKC